MEKGFFLGKCPAQGVKNTKKGPIQILKKPTPVECGLGIKGIRGGAGGEEKTPFLNIASPFPLRGSKERKKGRTGGKRARRNRQKLPKMGGGQRRHKEK